MKRTASTLLLAAGLTGAAFAGGTVVSLAAGAQSADDPSAETAPETSPEVTPAPDAAPPEGQAPEDCEGRRGHRGPKLEAAAEAIGVTVEDLHAALEDGQTIAQVAEANGVDVQTVIDALVADANAHLDEAVAEGRLSAEEADEKRAELTERITERVNNPRPERPEGERGPRGPRPGDDAPADAPEVEGSSFAPTAA